MVIIRIRRTLKKNCRNHKPLRAKIKIKMIKTRKMIAKAKSPKERPVSVLTRVKKVHLVQMTPMMKLVASKVIIH